eukprot:CAMPEP_0206220732 /NCGR_PEP_ID=MMETSP0047_2-20121206/5036_1 /ASSEMBLY_ACC=CAM_ASM_000192 /TAXON_ID=195065 /ORGANISM="Chroomonas mesostigmatica_cf, Strain CCMP1168" /LENGTH=181 /DNA_ID=CAMNT_0053643415 /DNA_START=15 /DNA_END=561 /DNA_ORIENTATION=+
MPVLPPMEEVKEYQKFVLQVLEKSDVEFMGGKRIVKRSGWRKLALTFGVSFELLTEEITRDDNYNVIYAKFTQRAILPNGRFADGWGACDHREKKFAKPNHDIAATAETRAKNRACADLFGIGDAKADPMGACGRARRWGELRRVEREGSWAGPGLENAVRAERSVVWCCGAMRSGVLGTE